MSVGVAVRAERVCQRYQTARGDVTALDDITLSIAPGVSIAVTGPTGSGKSTLLSIIGALERPVTGTLWLNDVLVSGLAERDRARLRRSTIGFLFQNDNLLAHLTASENVALPAVMQSPRAPAEGAQVIAERGERLLRLVGLGDHLHRFPDQMSGGQRQRVAAVRALIHRPPLLLADEPTGSVDHASAAMVIDLLLTEQRASGATLVVVTHDAGVARQMDRTVELTDCTHRNRTSDRDHDQV